MRCKTRQQGASSQCRWLCTLLQYFLEIGFYSMQFPIKWIVLGILNFASTPNMHECPFPLILSNKKISYWRNLVRGRLSYFFSLCNRVGVLWRGTSMVQCKRNIFHSNFYCWKWACKLVSPSSLLHFCCFVRSVVCFLTSSYNRKRGMTIVFIYTVTQKVAFPSANFPRPGKCKKQQDAIMLDIT